MNNKYCFPYEDGKELNFNEEKARDMMIDLFNPVLKFLFLTYNKKEFLKYGFNSCRQTAILGAYFVKKFLPDYEVDAYEGSFTEYEGNYKEDYIHAFIIAKKDDRSLLIDLSRTTKRLLFHPVFDDVYPKTLDYSQVEFHEATKLDISELLDMEEGEYYTSRKPRELLLLITNLMNDLQYSNKMYEFRDNIYKSTTKILGG